MMKFRLFLIVLCIALVLLGMVFSHAAAQDDTPTPEGTEIVIVVEATETPTVESTPEADVVIVIEQPPADETPPSTNSSFEFYKSIMIYLLGGAVTVFGILTVVILSLVNSNTGVRQMLHDSVSKENFDTAVTGLGYTENVFKAVTPGWEFDEKATAAIRAKVQEIMDAVYPSTSAAEPGKTIVPPLE